MTVSFFERNCDHCGTEFDYGYKKIDHAIDNNLLDTTLLGKGCDFGGPDND